MQIVIEIPKHYYENNIKNDLPIYLAEENVVAILPKGHGRLIDADALAYELKHFGEICLDEAPTIIAADKKVAEDNCEACKYYDATQRECNNDDFLRGFR